jgi:hypothetical protein
MSKRGFFGEYFSLLRRRLAHVRRGESAENADESGTAVIDHGCPNLRSLRVGYAALPPAVRKASGFPATPTHFSSSAPAGRLSLPAGAEEVISGRIAAERRSLSAQQAAEPQLNHRFKNAKRRSGCLSSRGRRPRLVVDLHFNGSGHVPMKFQVHVVLAQNFERIIQLDFAFIDFIALGGQAIRDIH